MLDGHEHGGIIAPEGRRLPGSRAVYTRVFTAANTVVCFDESPTQLIGEVREPIPAAPGQPERYDCEYRRNGTANLFVFLDPTAR